jgi:hypothetical protein
LGAVEDDSWLAHEIQIDYIRIIFFSPFLKREFGPGRRNHTNMADNWVSRWTWREWYRCGGSATELPYNCSKDREDEDFAEQIHPCR